MSILIKNMDMPTHCTECDFWHDGVFEHCLLNIEVQNEDVPLNDKEYPDGCPLIEIQPHGRLIDAERLKEVFHRNVAGGEAFDQLIDIAPTIIPAEDGET